MVLHGYVGRHTGEPVVNNGYLRQGGVRVPRAAPRGHGGAVAEVAGQTGMLVDGSTARARTRIAPTAVASHDSPRGRGHPRGGYSSAPWGETHRVGVRQGL